MSVYESMSAEQRRLRGQIAAHTSWAKTEDRSARTRNARAKFDERFEREVDPDRKLPPAERARRAEYARKAYFQRLAAKSAKARSAKKSATAGKKETVLSAADDALVDDSEFAPLAGRMCPACGQGVPATTRRP